MINDLINQVPVEYIVYTLIVMGCVLYLCVWVVPKGAKWFNSLRVTANFLEDLADKIERNTKDIEIINKKIGRDYARLNTIQETTEKQQKYIEESLEERELILRSLLGALQGLQEIGANGPTKVAEHEIQAYLLKKSHESHEE